jgi:hypothetical protein
MNNFELDLSQASDLVQHDPAADFDASFGVEVSSELSTEIYSASDSGLIALWDYFNTQLFGGQLNQPLIIISRTTTGCYYQPDSVKARRLGGNGGELGFNAHGWIELDDMSFCLEMVKLMIMQSRYELMDDKPPSRPTYVDKRYAMRAGQLGLEVDAQGSKSGLTGNLNKVALIAHNGPFMDAYRRLKDTYNWTFKWTLDRLDDQAQGDADPGRAGADEAQTQGDEPESIRLTRERAAAARERRRRSKTKYRCPQCRASVWGKPGLNLVCGDCSIGWQTRVSLVEQ